MIKKIISVLLIVVMASLLVSCNNDGGDTGNTDSTNKYTFTGEISTIYYENLANVEIKYDDKVLGKSDADGKFNVSIDVTNKQELEMMRFSFNLDGYVFAIVKVDHYDFSSRVIVKANSDDAPALWADEFFTVGGKVVYHYDGETRVPGAKVYVDGHLVKVIAEDGNFDLAYVVKNSVITVEYEGYKFVDITGNLLEATITEDTFGLTFRAVAVSNEE
jgi:hypothetical protein